MSVAAHPDTPPEGEVRAAFQQALWEAEERTLAELRVVRETLRLAAEAATACDSDLAAEVSARRDVEGARRLQRGDRAINEANRRCFTLAVDAAGGDPEDAEAALFGVLMARAIERIGDNAVEIARQAEFVAFGRPAVRA